MSEEVAHFIESRPLETAAGSTDGGLKAKESARNYWFMTLKSDFQDEPNEEEARHYFDRFGEVCNNFAFQLEKGEENGYLHYQCLLYFSPPKRREQVKHLVGNYTAHLETAKHGFKATKYVHKEESRVQGPWDFGGDWVWEDYFVPRPWQKEVIDIVKEPCKDDRVIHWYWNLSGNIGKTALGKHLFEKYSACYLRGKGRDASYVLSLKPKIVVYDIPRKGKCDYPFLEEIKDGMVFCEKYKSCLKKFKSPHLVIFANYPPDEGEWTIDRYRVVEV